MVFSSPNYPLTQAGIGGLGPWELGLVLVIVLVVFGAGKLPAIGISLGQAIKNFKKTMNDGPDAEKDGKTKDPLTIGNEKK